MAPVIRIGVVDDDRMLVGGLQHWARERPDIRVDVAAATVLDLLAQHPEPLDVVLLDLVLRDGSDPADNVRGLTARGHRVLVVSLWSTPDLIAATFAAGAHGYLTKDHDLAALDAAVRDVAAGATAYSPELANAVLRDARPQRPQLSERERAVLVAYASGMTLKAAARHLGIRPDTAKTYLERVKAKYQAIGRPAYTKIDLARRIREDDLD